LRIYSYPFPFYHSAYILLSHAYSFAHFRHYAYCYLFSASTRIHNIYHRSLLLQSNILVLIIYKLRIFALAHFLSSAFAHFYILIIISLVSILYILVCSITLAVCLLICAFTQLLIYKLLFYRYLYPHPFSYSLVCNYLRSQANYHLTSISIFLLLPYVLLRNYSYLHLYYHSTFIPILLLTLLYYLRCCAIALIIFTQKYGLQPCI